jgi:hypothetical protein
VSAASVRITTIISTGVRIIAGNGSIVTTNIGITRRRTAIIPETIYRSIEATTYRTARIKCTQVIIGTYYRGKGTSLL